jgi:hypothetical protein
MPYRWVDPEFALEHKGVKVYHVYKDDDIRDPLVYWFTTDINHVEGCAGELDVRDLARKLGTEVVDQDESILDILKLAIDSSLITPPEEA